MVKYLEAKPQKKVAEPKDVEGSDSDPELEAFAQKEFEAQMKRM